MDAAAAAEAEMASARPTTPAPPPPAPSSSSDDPSPQPNAEASSSSSPAPAPAAADAAKDEGFVKGLEAEVGQALKSWGSFWGKVSKEVAPTLAAVQKDITSAATHAKTELNRLQAQAAEARAQAAAAEAAGGSATGGGGDSFAGLAMMGDMGIGGMPAGLALEEGKGKGREGQLEEDVRKGVEQAGEAISSLFGRLQASLPKSAPALDANGQPVPGSERAALPSLASFQQSLSSTLSAHPNLNPATLNTADLRASLTTTFQRLQTDLHLADAERLAEEYLKKSEGLLVNAGQFLSDAIKIVPPTGAGADDVAGVAWDGMDAWAIPTDASNLNTRGGRLQFAQSDAQVSKLTGKSLATVRQTRHLASLHALRSNRELLLVDPAGDGVDADVKDAWAKFFARFDEDGGVEGEKWTEKTWAELGPTNDKGVEELKALRDELVPATLDKETFWKRYFFRVHQIELDAERRSALLDTTTAGDAEEELFSWEDDEDESKPTSPSVAATTTPKVPVAAAAAVAAAATEGETTPTSAVPSLSKPVAAAAATTTASGADEKKDALSTAQASPRESSEGSYDVVSNTSGQTKPSVVSSPAPTVQGDAPAAAAKAADDDESEDSDWE